MSPTATVSRGAEYRPDIEGLRAVAVLLIAVYHIWFGTVSGGVDVFLLLTGFLITGSLVRAMERDGRIAFADFLGRIAKRLFPTAAIVLGAVLVGAYLLLPRSRWLDVVTEVQASALYYVNWHLANNSIDYLAQNNAASPVQHFWSLAIQGQFYLLWPILITVAGVVAARLGVSVRGAAAGALLGVLASSFAFSLWITSAEPAWAYFDTRARLWELALGGLLALALPYIRLPRWLRGVAGWFGLTAFVLCGMLVGDALPFPGYVALWPTLAATLIILAGAGAGDDRLSTRGLLSWKPLVWLGTHSYALFLWHWPVLIFYLEVTERVRPSLVGGFYVLGVSFALAVTTTLLVQGGVARFTVKRPSTRWSLSVGAAFTVPVLIATALWAHGVERSLELREELSSDVSSYPGAAVYLDEELAENLLELPLYPDPAIAHRSTVAKSRDCNTTAQSDEFVVCEFGDLASEHTIAMVGSSHVQHWFHTLKNIAETNDWHLVVMTKNSCHFSDAAVNWHGTHMPLCEEWNQKALAEVTRIRPDVVFTTATLSARTE
ncbi:MAG: acyltransferase, partial [Nocardiopsis sp. BM-2018]